MVDSFLFKEEENVWAQSGESPLIIVPTINRCLNLPDDSGNMDIMLLLQLKSHHLIPSYCVTDTGREPCLISMFLRTQYYYCYYFGWNYLDHRRVCALTLVDLFSYDQNMESEYCFKGLAVSASSLNVILDRLKNTFLEY